jgi:hypothetical protein
VPSASDPRCPSAKPAARRQAFAHSLTSRRLHNRPRPSRSTGVGNPDSSASWWARCLLTPRSSAISIRRRVLMCSRRYVGCPDGRWPRMDDRRGARLFRPRERLRCPRWNAAIVGGLSLSAVRSSGSSRLASQRQSSRMGCMKHRECGPSPRQASPGGPSPQRSWRRGGCAVVAERGEVRIPGTWGQAPLSYLG